MSKRPTDHDAFERKVRPIYDALDSRNWKGALKLCQQALQKFPDNELIKVLKAIGLQRSGKREEANQVADEVIARTPTDEQVLRLSTMVLRTAGRLSDITRMYEAAAAAVAPRGGELALVFQHEVFGGHVREQNFVKQQQVALRLSKAATGVVGDAGVSSERYGWWVVLSILLQARAALRARATGVPAPTSQVPAVAIEPEKLLALAEGMIARQVAKDGQLEGYEALMVYVDVLLAQGKTSEALSLVSGPHGASALRLPAERLQLWAILSALTGDLPAASALLQEGLTLNPDDWESLLLLLDCMLPGTAASVTRGSASSLPTFVPQHSLILISGGLAEQLPPRGVLVPQDEVYAPHAFDQAQAVLQKLVEIGSRIVSSEGAGSAGGKAMTMRGADLALVDLAARRHVAAIAASGEGSGGSDDVESTELEVIDAITSYYLKYGTLVSCAVDLRTYVSQLSADAARRLAAALQVAEDNGGVGSMTAEDSGGTALAALRRRVCAAQIRDDLGLPRLQRCEEGVELSRQLLELYSTAQPLQVGLDERERGAADELPVLAGSALVTAAGLAATDAAAVPYMLAAYGAFADAVRVRPFGAGMRISLAALATLLAAPTAAAAHIYKLDIKHIQMDTLGAHLLLPPLLAWPLSGATTSAAAVVAADSAHADSPSSLSATPPQLLQRVLRDTQALFDDHARDAGESLFTAYGHGMYTKVFEFTAFRERLAAAHTLAIVRAESSLADCLRNSSGTSSGSSSSSGGAGGGGGGAAAAAADATIDAMRSAAVAAAVRLDPNSLPSDGLLSFNWDLSTRPTWLPPCAAGPSAAVVEWWRSRAAGEICGQGYGRCWWSATGAAEGSSPLSAQWRASQASAAGHRWLLPHCIAGALRASAPGVLGLREAVGRLRGLMGEQIQNANGTEASQAEGTFTTSASTGCTAIGGDDLRRLDVTLYGAALAVQDCLGAAGSQPAGGPLSDVEVDMACLALGELAAAVQRIAKSASAGLAAAAREAAAWGGVLPGGSLAALSLLVREALPVAVCCVQFWQADLKALRKRKGKAGVDLVGVLQRLLDAVTATAGQLAASARHCADALTAATSMAAGEPPLSVSAAAENAAQFLKAHGLSAPAVSSESAVAAFAGLIGEQRITVDLIARQASAAAVALS